MGRMLVVQLQPLEILVSGYDPSFPDTSSHASPRGVYLRFLLAMLTLGVLWYRRDRAKVMLRQAISTVRLHRRGFHRQLRGG